MKIAVYTSITNGKDSLKDPLDRSGADFVLFSDELKSVEGWDVHSACGLFVDPRRNSRAPKILAHEYLLDYDYSVWIDGSIRLLMPARTLIETYLDQVDVALFRHYARDCIYEEAKVCTDQGLDDATVMADQVAKYARAGHPVNSGLNECGVILRRHNDRVAALNESWWAEYCRHSRRDQLSLNYVLRAHGITAGILPGTVYDNSGLVVFEGHLK